MSDYSLPSFSWCEGSSFNGFLPPNAVQAGIDSDNSPIYVGRAHFSGDLLPAKLIPSKNAAYVAYGGEEIFVEHFEVLCRRAIMWVPCQHGSVPPNALPGGFTSDGQTLFIGRVFYEGSQTVGKVHSSHGCCYIPYGGQEVACPEYEVLVIS